MTAETAGAPAAAEVFDLGYQRYEGDREGRWRSRYAIWRDGVRTALGLGRSFAQKVAPILFIGLTWLPAVIVIIISGFVSTFGGDLEEIDGPTFSEYYGWAFLFIALFSAIVAPELLCSDRRQGVITLYLVRPVTPVDYITARWSAFLFVTVLALWFPQAVIFVWNALSAADPADWTRDHLDVVPRFLAAGAVIAVVLSSIAMATASFTARRAYATISMLALVFIGVALHGVSQAFSGAIVDWSSLLNLPVSVLAVSDWIFAAESEAPLSAYTYLAWVTAVTLAAWAVLWWRYRRVAE